MKIVMGILLVIYVIVMFASMKGWGHVGKSSGDGYKHEGITYFYNSKSVREGSVGGVGGRNSGRGGK